MRGGGTFYWDSLSCEAEDGGTIVAVKGVSLGRWKRELVVENGVALLNVAWFGLHGDDSPSDAKALSRAARAASLLSRQFPVLLVFPHRETVPRPPARKPLFLVP